MNPRDCPIYTSDENTIRRMLQNLAQYDLNREAANATRLLCPADEMTYNIDNYVNGCEDREGRIRYILALIRDGKIACLHIPFNYELDPEFKEALGPKEIDLSYLFPKKKEEVVEEPEEPVQAPASKIVYVTNPRWEHKEKDEDKDKNEGEKEQDVASIGDTVILMADIKNCPEGAEVVFDIYDMSVKPPKKVDRAKGKHNKGLGKGEWVVADKENKGEELKLEFEATARSRTSEKCPIKILIPEGVTIRLHINPDAPESMDDTYILFSDDESQKMIQTIKDDQIPGDAYLDLLFTGIIRDKKYSLAVDPGIEGEPYFVFKSIDGSALIDEEEICHSEE